MHARLDTFFRYVIGIVIGIVIVILIFVLIVTVIIELPEYLLTSQNTACSSTALPMLLSRPNQRR